MSTKLAWIEQEIASLKEQGLFTNIRPLPATRPAGWKWTAGAC